MALSIHLFICYTGCWQDTNKLHSHNVVTKTPVCHIYWDTSHIMLFIFYLWLFTCCLAQFSRQSLSSAENGPKTEQVISIYMYLLSHRYNIATKTPLSAVTLVRHNVVTKTSDTCYTNTLLLSGRNLSRYSVVTLRLLPNHSLDAICCCCYYSFDPNPYKRMTFWNVVPLGVVTGLFFGTMQTTVQRISSTGSLQAARR